MATTQKPKPAQGPAQGGPEDPGTPNTSPSTFATDGFYRAMQSLRAPSPGWTDVDAPEGLESTLGTRTVPNPAVRVLGKLVRGVY